MSNRTEKAIQRAFKKLLLNKAFSKITVQDIADESGINRNTFYYHYQDIPTMLKTLFKDDLISLMEQNKHASYEEDLEALLNYVRENEQIIKNVYHTARRDIFDKELLSVIEHYIRKWVITDEMSRSLSEEEKNAMIEFCRSLYFGLFISWISAKNPSMEEFRKILISSHRIIEVHKRYRVKKS